MKLRSLIRRLVLFFVLPYFVYVGLSECPRAESTLAICVCYPQTKVFVPLWNSASAHIAAANQHLQFTHRVTSVTMPVILPLAKLAAEKWALLDTKFLLAYRARTLWAVLRHWATMTKQNIEVRVMPSLSWAWAKSRSWYTGSMGPIVEYWCMQYAANLERVVDSSARLVRLRAFLMWSWAKALSVRSYRLYVWPALLLLASFVWLYTGARLVEVGAVQTALSFLRQFQLSSSRVSVALREKSDFILLEMAHFAQLKEDSRLAAAEHRKGLFQVQDLLHRVKEAGEEARAPTDAETADSLDTLDPEEQDAEVFTMTSTLTQTVTQSPDHASDDSSVLKHVPVVPGDSPAGPNSVATVQSMESQLQEELAHWNERVSKFLNLTMTSLGDDFSPYLDTKVAQLTQQVSSNFTALQQANYLHYKTMNEMISLVDQDSVKIRTSGKRVELPEINRQMMRSSIEQCYNETETQMAIVEQHLNAGHAEVMRKYFEVAQTTVDVLESFADITMQDFSNRLSGLLHAMQGHEGFDDKWSWAAWKEFHAVKELIFQLRDRIFDDAEAYRLNPRGAVPLGLSKWAEFIQKMNFHVLFLLKDNDEYMKLMRAKANVAYQQREVLTREVEEREQEDLRLKNFEKQNEGSQEMNQEKEPQERVEKGKEMEEVAKDQERKEEKDLGAIKNVQEEIKEKVQAKLRETVQERPKELSDVQEVNVEERVEGKIHEKARETVQKAQDESKKSQEEGQVSEELHGKDEKPHDMVQVKDAEAQEKVQEKVQDKVQEMVQEMDVDVQEKFEEKDALDLEKLQERDPKVLEKVLEKVQEKDAKVLEKVQGKDQGKVEEKDAQVPEKVQTEKDFETLQVQKHQEEESPDEKGLDQHGQEDHPDQQDQEAQLGREEEVLQEIENRKFNFQKPQHFQGDYPTKINTHDFEPAEDQEAGEMQEAGEGIEYVAEA